MPARPSLGTPRFCTFPSSPSWLHPSGGAIVPWTEVLRPHYTCSAQLCAPHSNSQTPPARHPSPSKAWGRPRAQPLLHLHLGHCPLYLLCLTQGSHRNPEVGAAFSLPAPTSVHPAPHPAPFLLDHSGTFWSLLSPQSFLVSGWGLWLGSLAGLHTPPHVFPPDVSL